MTKLRSKSEFILLLLILLKVTLCSCSGEEDMTLQIDAGRTICFFQKAEVGQVLEVQYQVIDGDHGSLDISFKLADPLHNVIINDYKKTRNVIVHHVENAGEFVLCFDNTYSLLNHKSVFFYMNVHGTASEEVSEEEYILDEHRSEENATVHLKREVLEMEVREDNGEVYYVKVKDIIRIITRTLKNVAKARHLLEIIGATRSRDMNVAAEDKFTVDVWSSLTIMAILVVGFLQVFMLKKMFTSVK